MIGYLRPKRGWNIFGSLKSWRMTESVKKVCIQFLVNKSTALAVISQSWTVETDYKLNFNLYAICWHKQPPVNQTIQFDIKCQGNSDSYDQHGFSRTKLKSGQKFLFTEGGFYNKREYSGADWMDFLTIKHMYVTVYSVGLWSQI